MGDPIRVLQIVTQMHRAGLETMLMNYYRRIDRKKVQFDFLVHREGFFDYDEEILALGGKIYHVPPISIKTFPAYLRALKGFFAEHPEYRVVHSHLDALSAFALCAAKKAGVPVRIAHSHVNGFEKDKKYLIRVMAKRWIARYATHLCGCSNDALRFMFQKADRRLPSFVLPNAIDLEAFSFSPLDRERLRRQLGLENHYVIGHIGRFSPEKNQHFLLDVISLACQTDPGVRLLLVGTGRDLPEIQRKAEEMGLGEKVIFAGVRDDIPAVLSAMDVFVLPSHYEGFSIVLLEAQASGLCCIASDRVSPAVDVLGQIRWLSLEAGPEDWARQILENRKERRGMDVNRFPAMKSYDIEEAAKDLQMFYCEAENRTDGKEESA